MNAADEFMSHLEGALADAGRSLEESAAEVRQYAAERMAHLATLVGQPGYTLAVNAEAENIAMKAALNVVAEADETDERLIGVIAGAIGLGARFISGGAATV